MADRVCSAPARAEQPAGAAPAAAASEPAQQPGQDGEHCLLLLAMSASGSKAPDDWVALLCAKERITHQNSVQWLAVSAPHKSISEMSLQDERLWHTLESLAKELKEANDPA